MTTKWSTETTKKFVQEYRFHECLWNYTSPDYKNKRIRDAAYLKIVEAMNLRDFGIEEVKNKIKNLRSTYRQELKKMEESKSGVHLYESNIKWLKDFAPIYKFGFKPKTGGHENELYHDDSTEKKTSEDENCIGYKITLEERHRSFEEDSSPPQPERKGGMQDAMELLPPKLGRKFDKKRQDPFCNSNNSDTEPQKCRRDESDVFGESVAMQLKKMSEEKALLAKCRIQTVLTEFRIADLEQRKLTAPTASKRKCLSLDSSGYSRSYGNRKPTSSILENSTPDPLDRFSKFNFVTLEEESYEDDESNDDSKDVLATVIAENDSDNHL